MRYDKQSRKTTFFELGGFYSLLLMSALMLVLTTMSGCARVLADDAAESPQTKQIENKKLKLALVTAEGEYETHVTLPAFAEKHLADDYEIVHIVGKGKDYHDLPGLDALNDADIAVFSVHRRVLTKDELDIVRKFIADGKPLVAIRTTSHGFSPRNNKPGKGFDQWADFDGEVLGCNYNGHYPKNPDPPTMIRVVDDAKDHPIVAGLPEGEFPVRSWLYKNLPIDDGVTVLLLGRVGDAKPHEPVAWTFTHPGGGRVFYTSLGHQEDFDIPAVNMLLRNGINWAAGKIAKNEK